MNSWNIIREYMIADTRPGTLGRMRRINEAGDLFVRVKHLLVDAEVATTALNADSEVRDALLSRRDIEELRGPVS